MAAACETVRGERVGVVRSKNALLAYLESGIPTAAEISFPPIGHSEYIPLSENTTPPQLNKLSVYTYVAPTRGRVDFTHFAPPDFIIVDVLGRVAACYILPLLTTYLGVCR